MELQTENEPYFLYFKKHLAGPSSHRLAQSCGNVHYFQLLKSRRKKNQNNETILQSVGWRKHNIFATVEFSVRIVVRIFLISTNS